MLFSEEPGLASRIRSSGQKEHNAMLAMKVLQTEDSVKSMPGIPQWSCTGETPSSSWIRTYSEGSGQSPFSTPAMTSPAHTSVGLYWNDGKEMETPNNGESNGK